MLNKTFVLASMLGSSIAFSATCKDTAFNPKTNVLSSHCLPRDNSAYLPTELDLNKCFGYSDGELTVSDFVVFLYDSSGMLIQLFSGRKEITVAVATTAISFKRPIRGSGIMCTGLDARVKARVRRLLFALVRLMSRQHDISCIWG